MSFDYVLPEHWHWSTLNDARADGRSIVSGPFGSNIGKRFFVDSGVPVIRGNNLSLGMGRFSDDGFVYLTEEKAAEFKNCEAHPGDLLFTAAGTIGQVGIIPPNGKYPKYIISNKQLRARLDSQKVDPLFAYYWFASPDMVAAIQSRNTGSTIPLINLSVLKSLRMPVPPLLEQRQIVAYLSLLDDRITLLRETNATLEAIAQALFKSWFVDFDPVRAKMEGRVPEGMDEATAALFPGGFEESELGLVPRGWRVARLDDFLELAYGKALRATDRVIGDVPVYGSGGVTGQHNQSLVTGPSIIVGRKGTVGSLYWEDQPFFPIDTVFYVRTSMPMTYCFYLLQTLGLSDMNTDAAVPGLNRGNVYRLTVPFADKSVLHAFDNVVGVIRQRMFNNYQQAQTLATLRDTLLPRLISGQLRLPEAKAMVAGA